MVLHGEQDLDAAIAAFQSQDQGNEQRLWPVALLLTLVPDDGRKMMINTAM